MKVLRNSGCVELVVLGELWFWACCVREVMLGNLVMCTCVVLMAELARSTLSCAHCLKAKDAKPINNSIHGILQQVFAHACRLLGLTSGKRIGWLFVVVASFLTLLVSRSQKMYARFPSTSPSLLNVKATEHITPH